jgi:hypothetical protein
LELGLFRFIERAGEANAVLGIDDDVVGMRV